MGCFHLFHSAPRLHLRSPFTLIKQFTPLPSPPLPSLYASPPSYFPHLTLPPPPSPNTPKVTPKFYFHLHVPYFISLATIQLPFSHPFWPFSLLPASSSPPSPPHPLVDVVDHHNNHNNLLLFSLFHRPLWFFFSFFFWEWILRPVLLLRNSFVRF